MTQTLVERVISTFGLTQSQRSAALERNRDVVVTAGAGCGKTRTLVARYAGLLADGLSPRRVVAITFTKKAAREMRSRVRTALNELAQQASEEEERQRWVSLEAQMNSAQIGTIHSLCTEILRAHPAEARVDPRFEVLDEGLTAVLRAQVLGDITSGLVEQPEFVALFEHLKVSGVKSLLGFLLEKRLEAAEIFEREINPRLVIQHAVEEILSNKLLTEPIAYVRAIPPNSLVQSEGDKMASMASELLRLWMDAEAALANGDLYACAANLYQARRETMNGRVGKNGSLVKEAIKAIKESYDELLDPLFGGKEKGEPLNLEGDAIFDQLHPLLRRAFDILQNGYQLALRLRQALDFDDLENGALQLLRQPDIRARWQSELDALLVDEFQDTNARQREIVEALAGESGRLFLVGDARQSIYRFRRADVSVFKDVKDKAEASGQLVRDLDITYRAHEPLLSATGDLLGKVMGTQPDPARPYYVPFSPLIAERKTAPEYLAAPHVEFVLGSGENSDEARSSAARALAARLLELKTAGQIHSWDEVALLFRASTGFADYEDAFEGANIPFVTVAGRGFYERPEIRDVLNLLRALADPADNLALAGLLRSPAFGLSDAALYLLRVQNGQKLTFLNALRGDLSMLSLEDRANALRARQTLEMLLPFVDRIPVAELLKRLIDATNYRAILATDNVTGAGGRLWRNLDKLLGDAQSSQQVNVRDFLEYLGTINDAGAREGEAPAEAQGAVRLMTIHKSKGLEFPVVVLADAGREPRGKSGAAYLSPKLGFAFKVDPEPLLFRLAAIQDKVQNEAETWRMLYVALTRAKDKLLISGHACPARSGSDVDISAWLSDLFEAAGFDLQSVLSEAGTGLESTLVSGSRFRAWCIRSEDTQSALVKRDDVGQYADNANLTALYKPLVEPTLPLEDADDPEPTKVWRATGTGLHVPPSVIGKMVHKALEHWLFPDSPGLIPLLQATALNTGLSGDEQRIVAVRRTLELLERLRLHPIWDEVDAAVERYHEVPYSRMLGEHAENGYIDLLYRTSDGWQVMDFKTDFIRTNSQREVLVLKYSRQMQRYIGAVEKLLGVQAQARMCFLDDMGSVAVVLNG